jgi:DNA-binding CsgD family transcriptional regulator
VIGPAGIGKTRFLAAVAERARDAGIDVLTATGAELERGLTFGGVSQLFESRVRAMPPDQRAVLLEGAARLGGELLGFDGRPSVGGTGDAMAAFHGLYWLCANLAADSPVALLVDDAHWLDEQSLAWIEYLLRRLDGIRILVVAATRPEEPLGQRLTTAAFATGGEQIELHRLSVDAVRELLDLSLQGSPDPQFVDAFEVATRGNPFLVHELLRTIRQERLPTDASGAPHLRSLGSDRIGRAVLLRLHRLSPASVDLARAIAILGHGRSLSVAARLAGLDDATAARALEALLATELLEPGPELRFHHPVVQTSVYQDIPAPVRALRHRQAARLLAESGASASQVASQLLEAESAGDPWTVAALRSAAHDARSRGAPRAAIVFLERALAELPAARDPELLLELGRAAHAALEIPTAIDALSEALEIADPADRGPAALELARVLLHAGRGEDAMRLLTSELAASRHMDDGLRRWLEVEYVLYAAPRDEAAATARRFRTFAGRDAAELAALAMASSMATTADEAAALARRALRGGILLGAPEAQSAWFVAPWMLLRADKLDEAEAAVEEALAHARARGWQHGFARASWLAAELDYRRGNLVNAEASLRSALRAASEGGSLWLELMSGALLAQVLADRGEIADAEQTLAALDISTLPSHERLTRTVHYARGYVALLGGRPREAVAELELVTEQAHVAPAAGSRFSAGMTVHSIALGTLGRDDEARHVADKEIAWATSWGVPRHIGLALQARAHSLNGAERLDELQRAVTILEQTPAQLELARALGDLGRTLRRKHQLVAARVPLRRALDLARRCRADTLAGQLRDDLHATGAKPRRDATSGRDSLTASETRIAEMAAAGMTNSQIAQALFVTPGTVEKHLTNVYAKLGISSRRHLAESLRGGD